MIEQKISFGFEVKLTDKGWHVRLPHQCDHWDIAGEDDDGTTHEDAVATLEGFIAEASDALEHLKARQQVIFTWPFGDPAPTKVVRL